MSASRSLSCWLRGLAFLPLFGLCACVMVPVPHGEIITTGVPVEIEGRSQATKLSTRADIALEFGLPQLEYEQTLVWIYHWTTARTGIVLLAYGGGSYGEIPHLEHFVIYRFKQDGTLASRERLVGEWRWPYNAIDWECAVRVWLHPEHRALYPEKRCPALRPETTAAPQPTKPQEGPP